MEHQFNQLQAKLEVVLDAITGIGDWPEEWFKMMPKFHPNHAVEIIAPKYGSAYRIGGSLLLTCKHLFDDINNCKVRFRSLLNYSDK